MMDNKIPNYLLNTLKCIYRNKKVGIEFNDGISEPIHVNKGVRQVCGLSPVLFNIQGVTGGTGQTSGECSLGYTIPI